MTLMPGVTTFVINHVSTNDCRCRYTSTNLFSPKPNTI